MKKRLRTVLSALALAAAVPNFSQAQGCSDAGFCTLDPFKPAAPAVETRPNNYLRMGASTGAADYDIAVFGGFLEYGRQFGDRFGLSAKLTGLAQQGNDVSAFGLSDVFLTADYAAGSRVRLSLGTKIPLNAADRAQDGRVLPMDYQSSLGTVDLIAGIGYTVRGLDLVLAVQQPLTQNDNAFFANDYPPGSVLSTIQTTNGFQRAGDVLLRASYPIGLGSKWRLTPSLLPIYHLADDRYTDAAGTERTIDGSAGLTLNAAAFLDYQLSAGNALQLSLGMPLVVREARPDGLTRGYVATLEYRVAF